MNNRARHREIKKLWDRKNLHGYSRLTPSFVFREGRFSKILVYPNTSIFAANRIFEYHFVDGLIADDEVDRFDDRHVFQDRLSEKKHKLSNSVAVKCGLFYVTTEVERTDYGKVGRVKLWLTETGARAERAVSQSFVWDVIRERIERRETMAYWRRYLRDRNASDLAVYAKMEHPFFSPVVADAILKRLEN